MRATSADTIRNLITTIPDQRLRELVIELLLGSVRWLTAEIAAPEPALPVATDKARRHWSRSRRDAHNAQRREQRRVARAGRAGNGRKRRKPTAEAAAGNGAEPANGRRVPVTAAALWQHAAKLEPKAPWRAVVRELGVPEGAAQNAHRDGALPSNISAAAAARFLAL